MMSSASHPQQPAWGGADGIAYIHTTPVLQGKPVDPQSGQLKSPFLSPAVQAQPLTSSLQHQHTQQQQQQQQQQQPPHQQQDHLLQAQQHQAAQQASQQHALAQRASSLSKQHHLPMIMEQTSNASISPSQTEACSEQDDDDDDDDDAISQTTSSYSSPSASTAANASSSDLRAFPQGSLEQPLDFDHSGSFQMPGAPQYGPGAADTPPVGQQPGEKDCRVGTGGLNKSRFRGVSYDKKKRKWRVQIKVATLGKSGVSVGYYDTEMNAARAYDRAAIGLLGRDNCSITTNFPLQDYDQEVVPQLIGKTREEVKTTLKNERAKVPRRRFSSRQRTSRFMGVGSSNRKNQWQARILVHGKVTHLGYYETEEDAARVYDRVSISLHGPAAQTNFAMHEYHLDNPAEYSGLDREDLQRALGVKPMDKSSKFRGVSKKKGKWEAKVMVNRKWAYRELFDSEEEAARAYDGAVWRLKPKEAKSYVNFKERPGQASTKLAKAARAIERAQAKERVGSSQSSPSSCRSLPPLAPAHDSLAEGLLAHGFAQPQQQAPLSGFPVGIKQEPQSGGPSFSPHMHLSRAAQSAAVANLGVAPAVSSPGSLSRTSSSHIIPTGLPRAHAGSIPSWLSQPLTAPPAYPPQRPLQLDSTTPHFSSPARSFMLQQSQQPAMPAGLMPPQGMMRTLSEADISNQSAMSAMSNTSMHHQALPLASARQLFHMHTMPGAQSPRYPTPDPLTPQKLRSSMSYQELTSNPFKVGSPPNLQSSMHSMHSMPTHLQQQNIRTAQQQQQDQQQQQQTQSNSMMVRVGSETHFIPESQANLFGMPRIPSAPYMQLDQRSSQTSGPNFLQELQLQGTDSGMSGGGGAPGGTPFGQWAPDSHQVLGTRSNDATDMQVDSPTQPPTQDLSANFSDPNNGNFSMPYMDSQPSPSFKMHSQRQSYASPHRQQPPPMFHQLPSSGPLSPQQQSPQMPYPYLSPSQQHMQSHFGGQQQQQHEQQLQQQQQQQHRQQQQQHMERLEHQIKLQQALQQQMQHMQQQQQQGEGQGMPRSASVSHLGMQWQPASGSLAQRCASTSNLMLPGQDWMHQEDSQAGYGHGHMHHSASSLHMQQADTSAGQQGFDGSSGHVCGNPHQMSADLLADLTGSQLLAQADLTECNSPLKIVQIGGDDLFETDEAAGNDYLLDTEAGLSPHA